MSNATTLPLATPAQAPSASLLVAVVAENGPELRRIVRTLLPDEWLTVLARAADEGAARADVVVAALDAGAERAAPELRRIRKSFAERPLVVVSPASDVPTIRRALAAGASGFVLADELETALAAAVRAAAAGYLYVPRLHRHTVWKPELSHRERQVLRLAALGRTNSEIARELCLAESTVKTHLSAAFREIGVRSRRQAAALVFDPNEGLYPQVFGPIPP